MCLSKDLITNDIHAQVGLSVDFVLKTSLIRQTLDNITTVMLFFEGFEKVFNLHKQKYSDKKDKKDSTREKDSQSNKDKESNTSNKVSSTSSTKPSNSDKHDKDENSSRKIKTANGMIKKSNLLLPKNSTSHSSIVSNEIKEKEKGSTPKYSTHGHSNSNYNSNRGEGNTGLVQGIQGMGMNSTFNYKTTGSKSGGGNNLNINSSGNLNSAMNSTVGPVSSVHYDSNNNPNKTDYKYQNKLGEVNETSPLPSTTKNSKSKNMGFFKNNH